MKFVLVCLVAGLGGSACRKHTTPVPRGSSPSATLVDGTFIYNVGTYRCSGGAVAGELTIKASSAELSCKVDQPDWGEGGYGNTTITILLPLDAPGDPWFIFFEDSTRLWVFNGTDHLSYRLRDTEDGNLSGDAIHSGKLRSGSPEVPRELVLQLPPNLRKLFHPAVGAPKRPSI